MSFLLALSPPRPTLVADQLNTLWNRYVDEARQELLARTSTDEAAHSLTASLHLSEYAAAITAHYGDGQPLDLRDHPPALPRELGRKLGQAVAEFVRVLRETTVTSADRSLVKHCAALTRLAEVLSRRPAQHPLLADMDITAHVTAMALIAYNAQALQTETSATLQPLLELVLWAALPYIERVFAPFSPWMQPPSHALATVEPTLTNELLQFDSYLERCAAASASPDWAHSDERRRLEKALLLLNAWMRCSRTFPMTFVGVDPTRAHC